MDSLLTLLMLPLGFAFAVAMIVVVGFPVFGAVTLVAIGLRQRFSRGLLRTWLIAGFLGGAGYGLYKMEWFDVWRHGFPPVSYLLTTFVPYMSAFAVVGYAIGHAMAWNGRASAADGSELTDVDETSTAI